MSAAGPPQGAKAPAGGSDPRAAGERGGHRPTVVLIPGLAADQRMWQAQQDELGAHWSTTVATAHQACNSITAMAQAVLDQHPGDLVLCGASMGGMVALEATRLAPSRIQGLALLGTVAHPETPDMHQLRSDAIALFEQGRAEEIIRANVALAFHPDHAGDPELTALYLDMVLDAGTDTLIRHNRAVMARPDARTHLRRIDCPTLVLCGEADQLTPAEHSQVIAANIPKSRLELIPRSGHMLTMEQPGPVNRLLQGWINGFWPQI
jgi:pimeloyl-ACP methyl ester carboxylesterase